MTRPQTATFGRRGLLAAGLALVLGAGCRSAPPRLEPPPRPLPPDAFHVPVEKLVHQVRTTLQEAAVAGNEVWKDETWSFLSEWSSGEQPERHVVRATALAEGASRLTWMIERREGGIRRAPELEARVRERVEAARDE